MADGFTKSPLMASPDMGSRKRVQDSPSPCRIDGPSSLDSETEALTRENTRRNVNIEVDQSEVSRAESSPQRPQRKKVRVSDPGPTTTTFANDNETGLTPGLLHTSFEESNAEFDPVLNSPSRRKRRQSTPLPQGNVFVDPMLPSEGPALPQIVHFTPWRQMLDPRTRRRLARSGLSDETNQFEQEKRHSIKRVKAQEAEIAALKQEVEDLKTIKDDPDMDNGNDSLSSRRQIAELEAEIQRLRQETSAYQHDDVPPGGIATEDIDTIMVDDNPFPEDLTLSHSPILRSSIESRHVQDVGSSADDQSISPGTDASTQVSILDTNAEDEMRDLSVQLEASRNEKLALFRDWRSQISPSGADHSDSPGSPPPEFMSQIVPTLKAALTQATVACKALDTVRGELSTMGFSGSNVNEIIGHLRRSFRSTRLELEHVFPGEMTEDLNDGQATLAALVPRLKQIANAFLGERKRNKSLEGTEKALRGQFDVCLRKYEEASKAIKDIEDSRDESAGDMLRARMKIQELEQEATEKDLGVDRLNAALSKYHKEVQDLEKIIEKMEADKAVEESSYIQQISDLEAQVAVEGECRRTAESLASERETKIAELEAKCEEHRNHIRVLDATIATMEREIKDMIRQVEQTDQNIGALNARLAEKSTALEDAKLENNKLARRVSGLEGQIKLEASSSEKLMRTVTTAVRHKRRSTKANEVNWKNASDDIDSEPMLPGSEPYSPVRASTSQYENVRVGRGKERRSLDSGIGIFTEESEGDNGDEPVSDFVIAEAASPVASSVDDGQNREA